MGLSSLAPQREVKQRNVLLRWQPQRGRLCDAAASRLCGRLPLPLVRRQQRRKQLQREVRLVLHHEARRKRHTDGAREQTDEGLHHDAEEGVGRRLAGGAGGLDDDLAGVGGLHGHLLGPGVADAARQPREVAHAVLGGAPARRQLVGGARGAERGDAAAELLQPRHEVVRGLRAEQRRATQRRIDDAEGMLHATCEVHVDGAELRALRAVPSGEVLAPEVAQHDGSTVHDAHHALPLQHSTLACTLNLHLQEALMMRQPIQYSA
mmetsp:Transcript_150472/g.483646  ORF Transcript_150472/g.483646 Transcript_150472/m.483646 type:complete len:265 (-) Transcript_150472:5404-6198(-)